MWTVKKCEKNEGRKEKKPEEEEKGEEGLT